MEGVLLCGDLLPCIFSYLHRHEAARCAGVHTIWAATVRQMTATANRQAGCSPFRTRIIIGCSPLGRLVDVSSLVDGLDDPSALEQRAAAAQPRRGRRKVSASNKEFATWLTSPALSPYGTRYYYCCEYKSGGITCVNGSSLQHRRVAARHSVLRQPEGVAFTCKHMYIQSNWGQLSRCSLDGQVIESMNMLGSTEGVTWGLVPGPDNALYATVDQPYYTRIYTDVPSEATGYVIRVPLNESGGIEGPGTRFTTAPMKRPCGLRWGPVCGTLFVTCLNPAIMRFAGPNHAHPGSLLCCITPQPAGLLPWDVVVVQGKTLVVSMHAHRTMRVRKVHMVDKWPVTPTVCQCTNRAACIQCLSDNVPMHQVIAIDHEGSGQRAAAGSCSQSMADATTVTSVDQAAPCTLDMAGGSTSTCQHQGHLTCPPQVGGNLEGDSDRMMPHAGQVPTHEAANTGIDADFLHTCNVLCVMEELGHGRVRVLQMPSWMHHANMMCTDDPYP